MRSSGSVALVAALFTAAPAMGAPVGGLAWVSICTAHGAAQRPVPLPSDGFASACHALCNLPDRGRARRLRLMRG